MSEEVNTTGWDAIDEEMSKIYGDQEPKHYGTLISYALGGPDPLEGISAYKSDTPNPHWHFVTNGFSELYDKESDNADESGYGFELTFRLTRNADEEEPPAWALNLLQNMGRYVFNTGNVFRAGDYLDANGPICLESDTDLIALAFINNPELTTIDTPNGQVQFLQMVGITGDELEAMQVWNTLGVLSTCQQYMPQFITDLERDSLLRIPAVSEVVHTRMEQDGSSTGFLFVSQLEWESGKKGWFKKTPSTLKLGAKQAEIIGKLLRGRITKGNKLSLVGPDVLVVFEPGEKSDCIVEEGEVRIILNNLTAAELSKMLLPKETVIKIPSIQGLIIQIIKTNITDSEGNVVKIIG
ncbi:suppressor of fused domain protein [Bacillus sp. JJ722]|uniref:suppressor of fused domain protein n=1 Tax=Bacillus sp. JJ722 TaxID=3122973 RepID=UPI002FFFB9AC